MTAYNELKNLVLGEDFPWFFVKDAVRGQYSKGQTDVNNFPFFSHVFLDRPRDNKAYAVPVSSVVDLAEQVFCDICNERDIPYMVLYRANANMTLPTVSGDPQPSPLHKDHDFPHRNMLVYLTDCNEGPTIVLGEEDYYGKEDDVYIFEGLHQHKLPTSNRRVVLVYTFL
jgi:hypothetical protein|tara:strand:- start:131 stop:640 length:510 start_codon:yes stop_codon:yes gene_type:complete